MKHQQNRLRIISAIVLLPVVVLPFADNNTIFSYPLAILYGIVLTLTLVLTATRFISQHSILWANAITTLSGGLAVLFLLDNFMQAHSGYWFLLLSAWLQTWYFSALLTHNDKQVYGAQYIVPLLFGIALLILWEAIVRGANISPVLLPPPSAIAVRFASETAILFADFRQTVLKAALIGYLIGCCSGAAVAVATDRIPFLRRGLLPLGNFVSALPIIGIAPIMVMWFGFDWQSKAAVVIVMTFFPMLINTVAGLRDHSTIESDLMSTYAASYRQRLIKLNLPAALPFIFNALKINSTLALIGAIVAEFFGTPIVGMGFRISTEVGRMNLDVVWAEIAVAALTGTIFYGILSLLEKWLAFWHPSIRHT
ncbi:MAG: ABC transporter permease [Proteobacteria bacterium]|nr:ABC transporter permease [Pseudomonadota bacterium]